MVLDKQSSAGDPRQDWSEFGESLTATRRPILHIESENGVQPLRDTVSSIDNGDPTGATFGRENGEIYLDSGTDVDDSIKLESNAVGEYASSRQAQAALKFHRDIAPEGTRSIRWGYFNADNGLIFEEDANGTTIVIRRNGTDRRLADIDPAAIYDSPKNIDDIPKDIGYVYAIDYAWYGAGPVIFSYELPGAKNPRAPVSKSQLFRSYDPRRDPGISGSQFMATPNLPLRVEIDNGSNPPAESLRAFVGGRQFSVVGNFEPNRRPLTQRFTGTLSTADTEEVAVAIRPRLNFAGRENGVNARIESINVTANAAIQARCEVGGDVSGTWDDSVYADTDSSVEIETNPTVNSAGLQVQPRIYQPASGQGSNARANAVGASVQPLGVEQPFIVYLEAESDATDYSLIVNWNESF